MEIVEQEASEGKCPKAGLREGGFLRTADDHFTMNHINNKQINKTCEGGFLRRLRLICKTGCKHNNNNPSKQTTHLVNIHHLQGGGPTLARAQPPKSSLRT